MFCVDVGEIKELGSSVYLDIFVYGYFAYYLRSSWDGVWRIDISLREKFDWFKDKCIFLYIFNRYWFI